MNMGEKVLKQHSESYLKKIELDREIKSREMELRVHGLVLEDKKQREVEHFQQTVLDQRVIEQRVQEQMKQQVQVAAVRRTIGGRALWTPFSRPSSSVVAASSRGPQYPSPFSSP